MKKRIENTTKLGRVSEEIRKEHEGFSEWNSVASRHDHQTILQVFTTLSLFHGIYIYDFKIYLIFCLLIC
jgi:hypothetical protein